MLKIMF